MKKTLSLILVASLLMLSTSFSFAASSDPSQSVAAHITVEVTPIDVTVPSVINMTAPAKSVDLEIDDYTVKNNSPIGTIKVDSLSVSSVNGWTLVSDAESFKDMKANSKKFSFKHGTHDFGLNAQNATETLTTDNTVAPQGTLLFTFSGKTGVVTQEQNDIHVANVVATLGYL